MRLTPLAIPLVLLAGCAATPPKEGAAHSSRTDACVFQSTITAFRALDDTRVLLYDRTGNKNVYLAEVAPGCFDLAHQSSLAAIDGDGNGQICGFGRDNITYQQFGHMESCRVTTLERLTDERLAAVMEKKTKKPRKVVIE